MLKDQQQFPYNADIFVLLTVKNGNLLSRTYMREANMDYDEDEANEDEEYDEPEFFYYEYNSPEEDWYYDNRLDTGDIELTTLSAETHAYVVLV